MDINTAFEELLDAMDGCDYETAEQLAHDITDWLLKGGFLPGINRGDFMALIAFTGELALRSRAD